MLLIIKKNERNRDHFRNMKLLIFIEINKTLIIVNLAVLYISRSRFNQTLLLNEMMKIKMKYLKWFA